MAHRLPIGGHSFVVSFRHVTPEQGKNHIRLGRKKRRGSTRCILTPLLMTELPGAELAGMPEDLVCEVEVETLCSMSDVFTKAEGRYRALKRAIATYMEATDSFSRATWNRVIKDMHELPVKFGDHTPSDDLL